MFNQLILQTVPDCYTRKFGPETIETLFGNIIRPIRKNWTTAFITQISIFSHFAQFLQ